MKKIDLTVTNIGGPDGEKRIEEALIAIDGVDAANAIDADDTVEVTFDNTDATLKEVKKTIEDLGFNLLYYPGIPA